MYYTSRDVYLHISQQNNDPIVERKKCSVSGTEFAIYQSDLDFYKKISPTFSGTLFEIPTPTLCPEERQRRRMVWRNERALFRRKCDATGKDIISMYPPETPFPVYSSDTRWSDNRDPLEYGFTFDEQKTFTEQFGTLLNTVPRLFMYNLKSENSDYSNCSSDMKNCYLVTAGLDCEECYYGSYMYSTKDCVDNFMVFNSQRMYECVECTQCERCIYCTNTHHSTHCSFMKNCDSCSHCFGCVNMVNASYCFFNEQLTKEAYEQKINALDLGSYKQLQKIRNMFEKHALSFPLASNMTLQTEGCTGGYSLTHTKNCSFCFDIHNLEDCKYSYWYRGGKDCYDVFSWGTRGERIYESTMTGDNVSNCIGCQSVDSESTYCYYSSACSSCNYLFGCCGLKNKSYCIFNVQFTPEEREKEVARIVYVMQKTGERGEMISPSISVFGYNYSVAQEFIPESKDSAKKLGYPWIEYDIPTLSSTSTLHASELPDHINEYDESICSQIIACEESGKLYRITKQEFLFYKKWTLPLPRKHSDIRFQIRFQKRPPRELHLRICDKTGQKIISVYSQEYPQVVWSEETWKKEIYG